MTPAEKSDRWIRDLSRAALHELAERLERKPPLDLNNFRDAVGRAAQWAWGEGGDDGILMDYLAAHLSFLDHSLFDLSFKRYLAERLLEDVENAILQALIHEGLSPFMMAPATGWEEG